MTNSRRQKRNNQVWRRRQCLSCGAVVTTHEVIELESALLVDRGGHTEPFLPDKLLSELMLALRHRPDVSTASREVLGTIIRKLLALPPKPVFLPKDIARVTSQVLKRFDKRAYLRYSADH